MTPADLLAAEKAHLAQLLEAIQRCVYFLDAAAAKIVWPLSGETLAAGKKDEVLFGHLAAYNERFAKLQDTLAAGMRHAHLLQGESTDSFLKVLAHYEKLGVLVSVQDWQVLRAARNLAAHDYEIDYLAIADHFNTLDGLRAGLCLTAGRFVRFCAESLAVLPASADFSEEFAAVIGRFA